MAIRIRTLTRTITLSLALIATGFAAAEPVRADDAVQLDECVAAVEAQLDPRVTDALARIDGLGRRLLALHSYLRSSAHLTERWSWTQEQISAYEGSAEQRDLQQAIGLVSAEFVRENPGYELWVNPQVRSLDVQVEDWNTNESVGAAAEHLEAAVREHAAAPDFAKAGPERAARSLQSFLSAYVPAPTPTIAAPGLSLHGQMRAVDFQVHQDGQVVAGPRTSTMDSEWDAAGWSDRLSAAVRSAGARFVGPLASPREPWHYTFSPKAVVATGPREPAADPTDR